MVKEEAAVLIALVRRHRRAAGTAVRRAVVEEEAGPAALRSVITNPEATNTGPGFNRGSGGGARGCGFEERTGAYARKEGGGHFL